METQQLIPTDKTAAQVAAEDIIKKSNQMGESLIRIHQDIYDLLWNNPNATPQEICNALAQWAAKVFFLGSGNAVFLACLFSQPDKWGAIREALQTLMADNGLVIPAALTNRHYEPPMNVTVNPDGSVTLTPLPVEE